MAELIGGSGYDDVQATAPSSPSIGDTWFDESEQAGKIYTDFGGGADWHVLPVQDELQSGRTRELLLLLQDRPVPEVIDPLNIQTGLSSGYATDGNGDYVLYEGNSVLILDAEDGDIDPSSSDWNDWSGDRSAVSLNDSSPITGTYSVDLASSNDNVFPIIERGGNGITKGVKFKIRINDQLGNSDDYIELSVVDDGGINEIVVTFSMNGDIETDSGVVGSWSQGTVYDVKIVPDFGNSYDLVVDGTTLDSNNSWSVSNLEQLNWGFNTQNSGGSATATLDEIYEGVESPRNSGYVTDNYGAPTTAPADFQQWNAIEAKDVTTGGSTSATPVEFEILDSSDSVLNSTRIPKARIADEPFTMRNRVYSEDSGSDGQSDYQIATTGDGGHYGIPILTVVSVKKNGSVLDSANWSFDPDTDTVTIDTSNVTIASGDTIDIKYDFDVFDSTLQPRAYLNRASTSETSPSISHFRYEYVI
ncbi:hypothetical protein OSG_eHP3_00025 [environmental Halophage eHP-3]|nr:hypothetical protein OSG_eHP3_00025 [environmental Halophage eHP-3]